MMHKLAEMLKNKKIRPLDDEEKNAKLDVLSHLKSMAEGEMGHPLHNMKKVEVASDSEEGLKAGLDKARDMASHDEHPEAEMEDSPKHEEGVADEEEGEDPAEEAAETDQEEKAEDHVDSDHHDDIHDGLDDHEIDAKLMKLHAMKSKRHAALKI